MATLQAGLARDEEGVDQRLRVLLPHPREELDQGLGNPLERAVDAREELRHHREPRLDRDGIHGLEEGGKAQKIQY